ncbi:MAG: ATP-binding protein [Terracidiphilus sp.]
MKDGTTAATSGLAFQPVKDDIGLEHPLRDYRERFAFATEAAGIGYWFCNLPFDRLIWDERVKAHFWLPPDANVDIDLFYACLHPDDRERTRQAIQLSIGTRTQYDVEYRTVSPDGRVKWIRAIGRTAYDVAGEPVRFDGVTWEITALKEAEEARDRAQEALMRSEKLALVGRLAATVAHEINNPLAAVTNLLFLIEQSVTDATTLNYVKRAIDEAERISHIVTHTLHFNRRSDIPSWERVSQILDSALALYDGRLRLSGITLQRDYTEADRLLCLSSELRQVFANLIANALDAIQRDGKLIIRTRPQPHPQTAEAGLRITIADTGHGMDRDILRRLFEPFVSTKGDRGTGLGLWVSREILSKHRAIIRVRSRQTPGASGTVFSIWIPVTTAAGVAEPLPAASLTASNVVRA